MALLDDVQGSSTRHSDDLGGDVNLQRVALLAGYEQRQNLHANFHVHVPCHYLHWMVAEEV
jgi:hypothetical protein